MRNIIFYIWIFVCYMVGGGCSDFLEEYSRDQVYASSCKDLDEALIGNGYMESRGDGKAPGFNDLYYGYLFALDDDAEEHVAMGWGSHNPRSYHKCVILLLGRKILICKLIPVRIAKIKR